MSVNYPERINALWTVFLLGTLFHTDLGLMPLFHGQTIALSDVHGTANVSRILWLMLAFFMLPMIAIIATTFTHSKRYRVVHFGLTILYSVLNFLHVTLDLMVKPIAWYQIALMLFLFGVGLLLNWVAWQWMKVRRSSHRAILE
jgi:hypothetical protein